MNSDLLEPSDSKQNLYEMWDSIIDTVRQKGFFGNSSKKEIKQLNNIFQKY